MISSQSCLSHMLRKFPHSNSQDCTVSLVRNFSRTSILERKINLKKIRPYSYEKQMFIDVCKPKYAPNVYFQLPSQEKCQKSSAKIFLMERKGLTEENIYENILAKEILEEFKQAKLIAIVHRHSMQAETKFEVRVAFKRIGMLMKDYYGRRTIEKALQGTQYISIMPLFQVSEALVFSPEVKVDALLKTLKKTPQVTLLATIIDGRLLSKTETEMYATTTLPMQQALLVQTINSVATTLTSNLNHHAQTLVGYLDQHAGPAGSEGGASSGSEEVAAAGSEVSSSAAPTSEGAKEALSTGSEEVASAGSEETSSSVASGSEDGEKVKSSDELKVSSSTEEEQKTETEASSNTEASSSGTEESPSSGVSGKSPDGVSTEGGDKKSS